MTDLELAYLAGIVDSDGCISMQKYQNANSYRTCLTIIQRDIPLIEWLYANFSGSVNVVSTKRGDSRDFYLRWLVADKQTYLVLKLCLPYLKLKRPQAELAIELYEFKKNTTTRHQNGSFCENDIEFMKSLFFRNKCLNSPATTERAGSLTREMRQSELTEMKNRQRENRSVLSA